MSFKKTLGKTLRSQFMGAVMACGAVAGAGSAGYYIEAPSWDESSHPDKEQIVQSYRSEIQDLSKTLIKRDAMAEDYTMASIEKDPQISTIKATMKNLENTVDSKADILASKILITQKINERDLAQLAREFNAAGLAAYSDVKLSSFYANYRNELLAHEDYAEMDASKIQAFAKDMDKGKGKNEYIFLFIGIALVVFTGLGGEFESLFEKSKRLKKWADEPDKIKSKTPTLKRN